MGRLPTGVNFVLKLMHFVFKMMNLVLTMMSFAFKKTGSFGPDNEVLLENIALLEERNTAEELQK